MKLTRERKNVLLKAMKLLNNGCHLVESTYYVSIKGGNCEALEYDVFKDDVTFLQVGGNSHPCLVKVIASVPQYLEGHTPVLVRLDVRIDREISDTYHIPLTLFNDVCQEEKNTIETLAASQEIQALKERLDKLESSMQNIILDRKEEAKIPDRIPAYMKRY